jgi:hypothetical protein
MNREAFTQQAARLNEVNEVVAKLEPTIQAAAFQVLLPYVTKGSTKTPVQDHSEAEESGASGSDDFETFLTKHVSGDAKPADNVMLITAHLYSVYGAEPFSIEEIRRIGDDAGLTIPERIDMTLKGTKREGKTLYAKTPNGDYKPTVFGETVLKSTYKIQKGRRKRETVTQETQ